MGPGHADGQYGAEYDEDNPVHGSHVVERQQAGFDEQPDACTEKGCCENQSDGPQGIPCGIQVNDPAYEKYDTCQGADSVDAAGQVEQYPVRVRVCRGVIGCHNEYDGEEKPDENIRPGKGFSGHSGLLLRVAD